MSDISTTVRSLVLPIYLPSSASEFGVAMLVPVLPLFAIELGATDEQIGGVIAMQGLGAICAGAFVGVAVSVVGELEGLIIGNCVRALAALIALSTVFLSDGKIWTLALARFVSGVGQSFWQISRQTYVGGRVSKWQRGRANSLLGGLSRAMNAVGPALGGVVALSFGAPSVFLAQFGIFLPVIVLLVWLLLREADAATAGAGEAGAGAEPPAVAPDGAGCAGRAWWLPLLTSAPVGFTLTTIRHARKMLIPLIAVELGLGQAGAGLATAVSFGFEMFSFPAAGCCSEP
jgi:hypothetical protein